jgi:hypothetical protein
VAVRSSEIQHPPPLLVVSLNRLDRAGQKRATFVHIPRTLFSQDLTFIAPQHNFEYALIAQIVFSGGGAVQLDQTEPLRRRRRGPQLRAVLRQGRAVVGF